MKITIYSTAYCAECKALEQWFKSKDINYSKKVTDEDEAAIKEFMELNDGMISVPFTVIDDEAGKQTKISGYDRKKFEQVLGL